MEKINIAELLRDCPKGMELDCAVFENLEFDHINKDNGPYPIICRVKTEWGGYNVHVFTKYGCYNTEKYSKCVIFPKGKTTWEGFQRPFKDGDIITCTNSACTFVAIYKDMYDEYSFNRYVCLILNERMRFSPDTTYSDFTYPRLATAEEKQKLFDAIKANGYKWNPETKTLEKLIEPKFKVGDRVLWNYDTETPRTISKVELTSKRGYMYWIDCEGCSSGWWDETELTPIPNKFDITTLKEFDKVLARDCNEDKWNIDFFSYYRDNGTYQCMTFTKNQCIPYEGNQHLLSTTNDCDDFYKTWE